MVGHVPVGNTVVNIFIILQTWYDILFATEIYYDFLFVILSGWKKTNKKLMILI